MSKKQTITIAIPAYNEERNIINLLKQLDRQKVRNAVVEEIIVVSDGSTDGTVSLVKNYLKSKQNIKIKFINEDKQQGKASRENQIIDLVNSDILVLLDADILIKSSGLIETLTTPIQTGVCDFTSCTMTELPPRAFFEKILFVSMQLKDILFRTFKNGNNIYKCRGSCRTFSKKAYKIITFKRKGGEDMFSYLSCIKAGLKFKSVSSAVVYYRLPSNLEDHFKQSNRFLSARSVIKDDFNADLIDSEFNMSPDVYFKALFKALPVIFRNFIYVWAYLFVLIYSKLRVKYCPNSNQTWEVQSSKVL